MFRKRIKWPVSSAEHYLIFKVSASIPFFTDLSEFMIKIVIPISIGIIASDRFIESTSLKDLGNQFFWIPCITDCLTFFLIFLPSVTYNIIFFRTFHLSTNLLLVIDVCHVRMWITVVTPTNRLLLSVTESDRCAEGYSFDSYWENNAICAKLVTLFIFCMPFLTVLAYHLQLVCFLSLLTFPSS